MQSTNVLFGALLFGLPAETSLAISLSQTSSLSWPWVLARACLSGIGSKGTIFCAGASPRHADHGNFSTSNFASLERGPSPMPASAAASSMVLLAVTLPRPGKPMLRHSAAPHLYNLSDKAVENQWRLFGRSIA